MGGRARGEFLILRHAYISNISILLDPEFAVGCGWWSKGISEFRFGPNLLHLSLMGVTLISSLVFAN